VLDWGWPLAVFVLLAFVPKLGFSIPKLFDQPLNSPGTLALLAACLMYGGLALTYDIQFGFTGLLSFGHALYIALGAYLANIAITEWHWSFWPAIFFTIGVAVVLANILGFVSLRVSGIAFAMVTLAFAQAGSILVFKNPYGWTGGEEGLGADYTKLPAGLVGIFNTKHLYWVALGFVTVAFVIVQWAVSSSPGHIWQAIRENELRVEVLGLRPYIYKVMVFVLASFVATAGGVVYLLLLGGATPEVTSANFTLTLLVMVVIGGTGTRWGALLGGVIYTWANERLGDASSSHAISSLPSVLRTPLQQPLFVLGVLFILVVFFVPGGLVRIGKIRRPRTLERLQAAMQR
jgi:branched-chain amino acid transport system permease protein